MGPSFDLPYLIRRARAAYPDAPAVADRRRQRVLDEVVGRAERFANALDALGLAPGGVAILSENRLEYPELDLALALARRPRVALNSRLHRDDFRYALCDAGAVAIVHSGTFAEDAAALAGELGIVAIDLDGEGELGYERLVRSAPDDPRPRPGDAEEIAWITYTSGTTGHPKGVELSHRAIREVAFNMLLELGPNRPGERILLAQPLSHGAGYFVLPYLMSGGAVYVADGFDPEEILWAGERLALDTLKIVPTMLPPLLEACTGRLPYGTVIYGASPVPGPILREALDRFGPVLVQIYGQSEAPATLTCLKKEDHLAGDERVHSAGRAWRSVAVEVRRPDGEIADVGELGEVTVRGPHMMSGYRNLAEETRAVMRDGWIWTKDLGRVDERGFVYLLGRRDEMINSGGFNVAPREVERVLQEHPQVEECVVIGLPDPRWGSAISAVVRPVRGARLDPDALIAEVRERLSFRTPKRVVFVDEIPTNAYGKPDRRRLASLFEDPRP